MSSDFMKGIVIDWYKNIHSSDNKASWLVCKIAVTLVAWTSVVFILNQRLNPYRKRREEIYTATKQANGMSPNSVGLKDKYVFVKSTVLIKYPPYYNGDIVEKKIITISEWHYGHHIVCFLVLACMVLVESIMINWKYYV